MDTLLTATRPDVNGTGVAWAHLAVVAAWTVGALAVLMVRSRGSVQN